MILSQTDKKILEYLYHNQRESYTQIAKKLNLTRTQVEYNVKKYIESGIIKSFATFFDISQLGYKQPIALLIRLKNKTYNQKFIESISKENLQSYGKCLNKYDLYLNMMFKNSQEQNQILQSLLFQEYVREYKIIETLEIALYPLKFLNINSQENDFHYIEKDVQRRKLSKKDKQILNLLKNNGRIKIIEIARKTGISSELILYKIKKWQKEKFILGNKIFFDFELMGYSYTIVFLHINNLSEKNKQKIRQIAKNNSNVTAFGFMLDEPNCYFNLTHKTHDEVKKLLNTINKELIEEEIKTEIIYLAEEEYFNMLPFI